MAQDLEDELLFRRKTRRKDGRFPENLERNRLLFDYWSRGYTIRVTAVLASVPEGTVSGYFRKFGRAARRGDATLPLDEVTAQNSDSLGTTAEDEKKQKLSQSFQIKTMILSMIIKAITQDQKDPRTALDEARTFEEIKKNYIPTDEEMEAAGTPVEALLVSLGVPPRVIFGARSILEAQKMYNAAAPETSSSSTPSLHPTREPVKHSKPGRITSLLLDEG